jgi:hypothetical protein
VRSASSSQGVAETTPDDTHLGAVLVHRDGRMILDLMRGLGIDDATVESLLDEGTIVSTNKKPPLHLWWLFRWSSGMPRRHRIERAFFSLWLRCESWSPSTRSAWLADSGARTTYVRTSR